MEVILYAAITIFGWGVWLAPAQNIPFKNQNIKTFYIALANLALSFAIALSHGLNYMNFKLFIFPFLGGIIWSLGGTAAFVGTSKIGIAKAVGIWAPINIIASIFWGIVLFGEFLKAGMTTAITAAASISVIIVGILLIIFAGTTNNNAGVKKGGVDTIGIAAAAGAGILWGSYFIPIRLAQASLWITAFPMAVGMFAGSVILVFTSGERIRLEKSSYYFKTILSGLLWTVGNFGSLKIMELIGTGKGFTVAQLCIVVNTLIGIFIFKNPDPKTKEVKPAFLGIFLAALGGVILGNLK